MVVEEELLGSTDVTMSSQFAAKDEAQDSRLDVGLDVVTAFVLSLVATRERAPVRGSVTDGSKLRTGHRHVPHLLCKPLRNATQYLLISLCLCLCLYRLARTAI